MKSAYVIGGGGGREGREGGRDREKRGREGWHLEMLISGEIQIKYSQLKVFKNNEGGCDQQFTFFQLEDH